MEFALNHIQSMSTHMSYRINTFQSDLARYYRDSSPGLDWSSDAKQFFLQLILAMACGVNLLPPALLHSLLRGNHQDDVSRE